MQWWLTGLASQQGLRLSALVDGKPVWTLKVEVMSAFSYRYANRYFLGATRKLYGWRMAVATLRLCTACAGRKENDSWI
jgi:hypothetical protein